MRYAVALLLLGHGIAHLPGFLVGRPLATFPELQFRTTVMASQFDVGTIGARVIGTGWLVIAAAFVAVTAMIALRSTGWPQALPVVVTLSLLLCVLGWPEARIGLAVNGAVALGLALAR